MSKSQVEKLVELYKSELDTLESELKKLGVRYEGMVAREQRYLKDIEQLEKLVERYKSELEKLGVRYEGMLAREQRYLKEIEQLKTQNDSLYRTYSYRLGFLLIHCTKSFKNFINLPSELIKLYRDNKRRKSEKILKKKTI